MLFLYNITPVAALRCFPFELVYGRTARGPFEHDDWPDVPELASMDALDLWEQRQQQADWAVEKIALGVEKYKEQIARVNARRQPADDLTEGDCVMVARQGAVLKLESTWHGPFIVQAQKGHGIYVVKAVKTGLELEVARQDLLLMTAQNDSKMMPVVEMESEPEPDPQESAKTGQPIAGFRRKPIQERGVSRGCRIEIRLPPRKISRTSTSS